MATRRLPAAQLRPRADAGHLHDFKKQRFRWAYGAMQILRRHAGPCSNRVGRTLTSGQRYHFVAGWLPWLADGVNLVFNFAALGWSALMIIAPRSSTRR
jgi:cellulose synthase/poly-beta-1,6-N-acetylglucosamine synthase-like glycosyltransferase